MYCHFNIISTKYILFHVSYRFPIFSDTNMKFYSRFKSNFSLSIRLKYKFFIAILKFWIRLQPHKSLCSISTILFKITDQKSENYGMQMSKKTH